MVTPTTVFSPDFMVKLVSISLREAAFFGAAAPDVALFMAAFHSASSQLFRPSFSARFLMP